MARHGRHSGDEFVRTYRGSLIGTLVFSDLVTVGVPCLVFFAATFSGLALDDLALGESVGLVLAVLTLVVVVLTSRRCSLTIGPDGFVVRNRFRTVTFPPDAVLRHGRYPLGTKATVYYLCDGGRRAPVLASMWIGHGGDVLLDDLRRSARPAR